jgi:hypothetical protein
VGYVTLFNSSSGYSLQSFLLVSAKGGQTLKKGFPLLSRSPSAEKLFSAFIVGEIEGGR